VGGFLVESSAMSGKLMLNYKITGEGFPLVLVHGFLESMEMWEPLHPENWPYKCIWVDLSGHGKSDLEGISPEINSYAKEVLAVLQKEKIDHFYLIGHSMGGYVALEMANQTDKIDKMMLLNSSFWQDSPLKYKERERVLKILEGNKNHYLLEVIPNMFVHPEEQKEFIQKSVEIAKTMSSEAIITATRAMMNRNDNESVVDRFGNRLKIIQGQSDLTIPLSTMLEKISNKSCDFAILKGIGHMSHAEDPEDVRILILDFFKTKN